MWFNHKQTAERFNKFIPKDVGISRFDESLGGLILPILRSGGVALKGGETDDVLPMNPEGAEVDVPQGLHRFIKAYVG